MAWKKDNTRSKSVAKCSFLTMDFAAPSTESRCGRLFCTPRPTLITTLSTHTRCSTTSIARTYRYLVMDRYTQEYRRWRAQNDGDRNPQNSGTHGNGALWAREDNQYLAYRSGPQGIAPSITENANIVGLPAAVPPRLHPQLGDWSPNSRLETQHGLQNNSTQGNPGAG